VIATVLSADAVVFFMDKYYVLILMIRIILNYFYYKLYFMSTLCFIKNFFMDVDK